MSAELACQVLDFHDDDSLLRSLVSEKDSLPASIRKGEITPHEKLASMGRQAYALCFETQAGEEHRRFPLVTATDAWLSQKALEKNAHKLPQSLREHAQMKIAEAFTKLGLSTGKTASAQGAVTDKVFKLQEMRSTEKQVKLASITQPRTETKHFALKDKYPIDTEGQLKEASRYLDLWASSFPPSVRREYATKLASRATELKVELDGKQWKKYASAGYGTEVGVQLKVREQMIPQVDSFLEGLKKVSAARHTMEPDKFAELLSKFDNVTGLDSHYGKHGIEDPYATTFEEKSFRKVASGYHWKDEASGLKMSEKDLEKVSSDKADKLKSYLGESVAKELKKHGAAIFDSLPTEYKVVVAKIAAGAI